MADPRILMVEGNDDLHVIANLCARKAVPSGSFKIEDMHGVDRLIESFPVRLKASDIECLGVVVDADSDLHARWQSFHDRLRDAGYAAPSTPYAQGTILEAPPGTILPRVGIWIMPDNQVAGLLEDFLRFLIPSDDRLIDHVESSLNSMPADLVHFAAVVRPKAVIHTWLAWQAEPGKPYGQAITARCLDSGVREADHFLAWLRQLFLS